LAASVPFPASFDNIIGHLAVIHAGRNLIVTVCGMMVHISF
jgi:hypothetical protein